MDVVDGTYRKRVDPATGKPLPEDNWVWSPQGAIDMHMPERWGILQFSDVVAGTRAVPFVEDRNDRVKWALRRLYYRQRVHRATHGRYATDLADLQPGDISVDGLDFTPMLHGTPSTYELVAPGLRRCLRPSHPGRARVGHARLAGTTAVKASPATLRVTVARESEGGPSALSRRSGVPIYSAACRSAALTPSSGRS